MSLEDQCEDVLVGALGRLRFEYVEKLVLAARENRGDDVDHAATWIAVLDDVTGAVGAEIYERTRVRDEAETQTGGLGAAIHAIVERAETQ